MKRIRLLSVLNTFFFLMQVATSYFTQFKLINKKDVGDVSDTYSSLFTPAPVTFAIWGLIYFSLLSFCIYHLIMAWKRDDSDPATQEISKVGPWFTINNIATVAWLVVWTNEKVALSVVLIFIQLISLIIINLRLGIYDRSRSAASKTFTQFPLSIYFAWLTIACIANTSSYLASFDWSRELNQVGWTVAMISIAVLITILVILTRDNLFFGLVVIWALYGIVLKRQEFDMNDEPIIYTAWAGMIVTALACILLLIRRKPSVMGSP